VNEAITTALARTRNHQIPVNTGRYILSSPRIETLPILQEDFKLAWSEFQAIRDRLVSFTDCNSFRVHVSLVTEGRNLHRKLHLEHLSGYSLKCGLGRMRISLPYGRSSLSGFIPHWAIADNVDLCRWPKPESDPVKTALEQAIGPRLQELARHCRNAVFVTCDKTRGVPTHTTLPLILEELKIGGINVSNVRILIATGLHRGETMMDIRERCGSKLLESMEVSIHDSDDQDQLIYLGNLTSGTPLVLHKTVVDSDLVIVEGTVEPHFFAGFTGGSKIILPGVAGTETVLANHSWRNIEDPRSIYGVLDNPVRADADESLRFLKKTFALNLILDRERRITFANSGDPIASFKDIAQTLVAHSEMRVRYSPDIVITTNGGYPLDRNLYQSVKGIAVPEKILHEGSRIIMVSECADGVGHPEFKRVLSGKSPDEIYERLRSLRVTIRDQWEAQVLCRILRKNAVWFVTRSQLRSEIESMHMHYASSIEEGLNGAGLSRGERVLVVPDGPSTILKAT
jgi:nickel-dependent lactate racemase